MTRRNYLVCNVYTKEIREAASDQGLSRKVHVLVADDQGQLVLKETTLPGPRARIRIESSRIFRVERTTTLDPTTGQMITDPRIPCKVQVRGNQNNPRLQTSWLDMLPLWRKTEGGHDVLAAIVDEKGSKIDFVLLDDDFEQQPQLPPAE